MAWEEGNRLKPRFVPNPLAGVFWIDSTPCIKGSWMQGIWGICSELSVYNKMAYSTHLNNYV
jgi:hypothetical protein